MSATRERYYRALFGTAALYDIVLGVVFTFFFRRAFMFLGIADKLPLFGGYISLIGAYALVFGVAYYLIARGNLEQNRDLILVGVLYKFAYCAIAFYYFAIGDVPHIIFVSLFGVLDLIFFVLMAECAVFLSKPQSR